MKRTLLIGLAAITAMVVGSWNLPGRLHSAVAAFAAEASPNAKEQSRSRSSLSKWTGTWLYTDDNGSENVTISTKSNSLSASFKYTRSAGRSGNGQWTNCNARGNTLKCDWTAEHDDPEKTGTRRGTLKMTLSGDTISGTYLEDYASWNWKPGYGPHVFDGSMGKDVVHSRRYNRQKSPS